MSSNTLLQVGSYRLLDSSGKIPVERLPDGLPTAEQVQSIVTNSTSVLADSVTESVLASVEQGYVKKTSSILRGTYYEEITHPSDVTAITLRHGCVHIIHNCGYQKITLSFDKSDVPEGTGFDSLMMVEVGTRPPEFIYPTGCIYGMGVKPRAGSSGIWYFGFAEMGGKVRIAGSGPFAESAEERENPLF